MYILLFIFLCMNMLSRESALIKSLHLHQGYLLNKRIVSSPRLSNTIKNVLNKPLLRANAEFARYANEHYLSLIKIDGVLSTAIRSIGSNEFGLRANRPFFHMDDKSFMFHPNARQAQHALLCPDIKGVFMPNAIINTLSEKDVQLLIKKDYKRALEVPLLEEHDFVDQVLDGYKQCKKRNEQLCLTQIIMHTSIAHKLLYSMLDANGNPITNNSISHALNAKHEYVKDPLAYKDLDECLITLRRVEEDFEHTLQVRHYFSDETRKWIDSLLQF